LPRSGSRDSPTGTFETKLRRVAKISTRRRFEGRRRRTCHSPIIVSGRKDSLRPEVVLHRVLARVQRRPTSFAYPLHRFANHVPPDMDWSRWSAGPRQEPGGLRGCGYSSTNKAQEDFQRTSPNWCDDGRKGLFAKFLNWLFCARLQLSYPRRHRSRPARCSASSAVWAPRLESPCRNLPLYLSTTRPSAELVLEVQRAWRLRIGPFLSYEVLLQVVEGFPSEGERLVIVWFRGSSRR